MFSFDDLRDSGMLWYLNRVALHPRGLALALHYDEDDESSEPVGWSILVADDGIWGYPHDMDQEGADKFAAFLENLLSDVENTEDT